MCIWGCPCFLFLSGDNARVFYITGDWRRWKLQLSTKRKWQLCWRCGFQSTSICWHWVSVVLFVYCRQAVVFHRDLYSDMFYFSYILMTLITIIMICKVFTFAEGTTIVSLTATDNDIHNIRNDLRQLSNWSKEWLMLLTIEKCTLQKVIQSKNISCLLMICR